MNKIILAVFSGALIGTAFSYPAFSWLVWFGLAPFIYALRTSSFRQGLASAAAFTFVYYAYAMFWITHVTTLGFFLLMAYLSLYGILYFFLVRCLRRRALKVITFASAWVCMEFLKEMFWPHCGWAQLGYSQFKNIHLIQIADIGGVKMISWVIVAVNVSLAEAALDFFSTKRFFSRSMAMKALFVSVILLLSAGYSLFRIETIKVTATKNIGIVQPNIPEVFKYNPATVDIPVRRFISLARQIDDEALVVGSEALWPLIVDDTSFDDVKSAVRTIGRDVIFGVVRFSQGRYYNSAFFFDKQGQLVGLYDKIKLVPYGEYIPLRKYLGFISAINEIGDMYPGESKVVFTHQGSNFSVLICFEDSFPLLARDFAKGNDFLINITNDGWFYGEPETLQHLSVMVMRAIENRIPIVRSANTGISGWVSALGRLDLLQKQGRFDYFSGQGVFEVEMVEAASFYGRRGELFSFVCAAFLVLFLFVGFMRKKFSLYRVKKGDRNYEDRI